MKTYPQLQQDVMDELKWEPAVHAAQRVTSVKAKTTESKVHLTSLSQRTDTDIAESVKSVLEWTSSLPLNAVQATVEDGCVTLFGAVDWQYQRQAAADSVRQLIGVTGVNNQISILSSVTDAAVKSDIEAALKRSTIADAKTISVAVRGGEVMLSGTVHSWDDRDTAAYSTWGTPGVRNVVDTVTLAF